ncbi:hypothetical protein F442_06330 [Phytophthora nicotianae P10297]|uniref:Uncharacterized protein n=1 Tax=Phytophthora nicotianae P10297 TaxID=1317064 RepID=W2ZNM3_PHYNI|nr:hypothetical protein F442_06330 [Phytophthora nicotianae P10297]
MWDQNSFGFPNQPTSFVIDWAINSLDNTCLIAGSIRPYNGQAKPCLLPKLLVAKTEIHPLDKILVLTALAARIHVID